MMRARMRITEGACKLGGGIGTTDIGAGASRKEKQAWELGTI